MTRSDCGGLRMAIANAMALLRPSGALWLQSARALVVAIHQQGGEVQRQRIVAIADKQPALGQRAIGAPVRGVWTTSSSAEGRAITSRARRRTSLTSTA